MKKGNVNNDKFKVSKLVIIGTFFLFLILIGRLCYLCLVDYKVGNSTIAAFIKNRNTKEDIIMPKRGTIYDINGNVLANDVVSYTLIAYLSNERVDAKGNKNYVEDIDDTSTKLAGVLGVTSEEIKDVLVKGKESNKYQVEFGTIGKGLSELTKEEIIKLQTICSQAESEIDKLKLQGIDFLKDIKRYYPNGDFASYILGYTVLKEDDDKNKWITGELGLEEYYNDELKGKSGYITYERDKYGYKIAILSGGFTYFGHYLQQKYGIDYVYANELEIENGKLTGRYLGDVVDGKRKAELLRLIAQVEKVDIAQTIAVGDGANDLPMLGIAGLGIAFHAKPKVVANAKQSINTIGLDGVLYFLGFKDSYIDIPR